MHKDPQYSRFSISFTAGRYVPEHRQVSKCIGGNFVDVTLRVIVQQAPGTMVAFDAQQYHGTTLSHGVSNCGVSIVFVREVLKQFNIKKAKAAKAAKEAAGEGHTEATRNDLEALDHGGPDFDASGGRIVISVADGTGHI